MSASPGWILGVLFVALGGDAGPGNGSTPEDVTLRGKVLTLNAALLSRSLALKFDPEPIAKQVALVGEDGSIVPLLSDEASRALFLDERLRDCRTQVLGRRFVGVPYLQVISFKVEREGKFETPGYYCDVCAIWVRYPQKCPCCQGLMELRMKEEPEAREVPNSKSQQGKKYQTTNPKKERERGPA
ncbi:MAG TPA: hypothetical protein VKA15_25305 [Isosphaeraceae bacterium]|nr:hypothetical protein [Isosphaeraceae bacterium]